MIRHGHLVLLGDCQRFFGIGRRASHLLWLRCSPSLDRPGREFLKCHNLATQRLVPTWPIGLRINGRRNIVKPHETGTLQQMEWRQPPESHHSIISPSRSSQCGLRQLDLFVKSQLGRLHPEALRHIADRDNNFRHRKTSAHYSPVTPLGSEQGYSDHRRISQQIWQSNRRPHRSSDRQTPQS